jgi:hypothetical protein
MSRNTTTTNEKIPEPPMPWMQRNMTLVMLAPSNTSRSWFYSQLDKRLTCPTSPREDDKHENGHEEKWFSSIYVAELRPNDDETYARNEFG